MGDEILCGAGSIRSHLTPNLSLALGLLCGSAAAQEYVWTRAAPAASPLGRRDHVMVFDAARGVTVLFGGRRLGAYLNDMWTYDGSTWTQLAPSVLPPPRAEAAMAYDPTRQRIVLMSGTDGTTLTDVWEWDGTTWTQVATGQTQLTRRGAAAYDPMLGGVLYNHLNVNLVWDGATWQTPTVTRPEGGDGHVLVYDPASGGVMTQWGQYTRRFVPGTGWQNVLISYDWDAYEYAMALDPVRGRLALVGGRSTNGAMGTRVWMGSSWAALYPYTVGPGSMEYGAMVYDLRRNVFVHFGGESGSNNYNTATWELAEAPMPPATYTAFGAGCAGNSSFSPTLQADPLLGPRPVLGGSLMLRLDRMPPGQPVVGWYGASRTTWSGVPLPFDLQLLAMPGCSLLASADLVTALGVTSSGGVAWWRTAIPNDVRLAGQMFFQQTAVLAPGANAPGLLWSNAGEGTFGGR